MTTATRATMGSEHAEQVALVQWAAWKQGACPALRLLFAVRYSKQFFVANA